MEKVYDVPGMLLATFREWYMNTGTTDRQRHSFFAFVAKCDIQMAERAEGLRQESAYVRKHQQLSGESETLERVPTQNDRGHSS